MIVAIQPDDYTSFRTPDRSDASSPRWAKGIEEVGHEVRWVDVYRADILEQLGGCDGFMWRWAHFGGMSRIARRLMPVLEREMGLTVYPDQSTCWHYDDKIAQRLLLEAAGIPIPRTWVWFEQEAALSWAKNASYPVVLKLAAGAGSTNVRLVRSHQEACVWITRLFAEGVANLEGPPRGQYPWSVKKRLRGAFKAIVKGQSLYDPLLHGERHQDYVLFQEFLPDNPFDTRVTVIGDRAFAFRRFNRPNDFRSSGSGNFDVNPAEIDLWTVRLAFQVAQRLNTQSIAIDGLRRGEDRVVGEISYTYVSWVVHECPGHWRLVGSPMTGELMWQEGQMWPEEAQVQDFLHRLEGRDYT